MSLALDRQLLFVTGKGGVGKTTVAAALGLLSAAQGRRTLVCEVDAKGSLAGAYECPALAFKPREVEPRLFAMTMDTEGSLREYLALQLRLPLVARIGPLARTLDFVASAAPGVREILTVGKLCYEVRERHYDRVIVDAAASGHVIGQLTAPQTINELVQVGIVRDQTAWMLEILDDPARTGAVIVASPEEMPVRETIELAERLRTETDIDLAAVIVNRVLPELFGRGEEAVFEKLRTGAALDHAAGRGGSRSRHRVRRCPPGGHTAPGAGRTSRDTAGRARPVRAGALRARAVRPDPRAARHGDGGRRAGRGVVHVSRRQDGAARRRSNIEQLLAAKEIVFTCGSGGVGKTTTAAALGAMAASRLGGKVLVLTVDPARRLADAMGLEAIGNVETPISRGNVRRRGRRAAGRAVGGHARHEAELGRPRSPPRAQPGDGRTDPQQQAVHEHHGALQPEPRLRGHGAALRDPRHRPLRPRHR